MNRLIIGGIAALAIGLSGCSATGGAPRPGALVYEPDAGSTYTPATTTSPVPVTPVTYYVGDMVPNGSLRFRIDNTRRMAQACGQFDICYSPTGSGYEYFVVDVTVQNTSAQPVFYYETSQTLADHGQQITADALGTSTLASPANPIQPGMAIGSSLAFIVPKGEQPDALMVIDELYSLSQPGGVAATRVELVRS